MAGSGGTAEPVIRALPEAASLRLSAGQLIVDAAAVVKELVENALDAGATSVSVIVDKDLSSIVVKDNGAGLPVEGRDSIGAAHCTSKIRRFEDVCCSCSLSHARQRAVRRP
jgi:DNA mismatch repair protein MutL